MQDSKPIVCTLSARERRSRGPRWKDALRAAGARFSRTPGGVKIDFESVVDLAGIESLVRSEQECCAWMSLRLTRHNAGASLLITTDTKGGVEIIRKMVGM